MMGGLDEQRCARENRCLRQIRSVVKCRSGWGIGTGEARPILSVLLLVFYTPILMDVECLKQRLLRSTDSLRLWKARGAEEEG